MFSVTRALWYASLIVQGALIARLFWTRLSATYPFFTTYLIAAMTRSVFASVYQTGRNGALPLDYTYFWMATEPISLLLQAAVTWEIHIQLTAAEPRNGAVGRRVLLLALLAAIIVAALPFKAELSRIGGASLQVQLEIMFLIKRYVSTVLAIFLVAAAFKAAVVPRVPKRPRIGWQAWVMAMYCAVYAGACLFANLWNGALTLTVNAVMIPAITICFLIWLWFLKPVRSIEA